MRTLFFGLWLAVAVVGTRGAEEIGTPLYFSATDEVVPTAARLLAARDWETLARYYDLSGVAPGLRGQLRDGSFFLDASAPATGPMGIARWRHPFSPLAKLETVKPESASDALPRFWTLSTVLSIDQGGGMMQRVRQDVRLFQTKEGFQFLPPEKRDGASPAPVADPAWQARGSDAVLFYRPALRSRAEAEVPAGRAANLPALVQAIERLKPLAARSAGTVRAGSPPLEPDKVYAPTDDELLLSLAGERVWRTLQLAPPGTLARVRAANPAFTTDAIEYAHLEVVRLEIAGSGPHYVVAPPVLRRVSLKESAP